jgi:hypothetical protein
VGVIDEFDSPFGVQGFAAHVVSEGVVQRDIDVLRRGEDTASDSSAS